MYNASQQAGGQPGPDAGAQPGPDAGAQQGKDDEVTDVDFEEVK
jgi:molecular chaperone DnaK